MRTYLTKPIATKRYNLTLEKLEGLIAQGVVTVYQLESEHGSQPIVYDDDLSAYFAEQDIAPEQFEKLRGNLLGYNEAGNKYGFPGSTISSWVSKGWLKLQGYDRNRKLVDEADVAYLAALAHAKKIRSGKRLFS